jgi:hypothetical protein
MDCRSVSAAERLCDCEEGVQCPKERKPIFFMRAIYCYPSLFATVVVLSAATTIISSLHSITSSDVTSNVCYTVRPSDFVVVATARRSFTFFEAFSINFAIVVYFECMHVEMTCINSNFGDHGGQHGQESEEGEEGKENSQEEKEVTVRRKRHGIRIASEASQLRLRSTDRWQLPLSEYPRNSQTGSLCRWLLHNGPGFLAARISTAILVAKTCFVVAAFKELCIASAIGVTRSSSAPKPTFCGNGGLRKADHRGALVPLALVPGLSRSCWRSGWRAEKVAYRDLRREGSAAATPEASPPFLAASGGAFARLPLPLPCG